MQSVVSSLVAALVAGCSLASAPMVSQGDGTEHTIKIRLWDANAKNGESPARLLAPSPGSQSRDLGELIREETRRCVADPQRRCAVRQHAGEYPFTVEFRHADFDAVPGSTIVRNGHREPVPVRFGRWRNTIEVIVQNGVGALTIPVSWITNDTVLVIRSPWGHSSLHYPPSGALRTYGPSESTDGSGEFYRIIQKEEVRGDRASNYHFVR